MQQKEIIIQELIVARTISAKEYAYFTTQKQLFTIGNNNFKEVNYNNRKTKAMNITKKVELN
jgi:hypothetical protein